MIPSGGSSLGGAQVSTGKIFLRRKMTGLAGWPITAPTGFT
jgi:hypothetical protein